MRVGQALVARWHALWVRLVVKYRDGFVIWQNASKPNGDLAQTIPQEVRCSWAWHLTPTPYPHHNPLPPNPTSYPYPLPLPPTPHQVGYPEAWYAYIARDSERLQGKLSAPAPAAAAQRLYAQQLNTHECARAVCPLEVETEAGIELASEMQLEIDPAGPASVDPHHTRTATADAVTALSYGMLLAAVGCSLLVGAAAGGGAVHWAERRRRDDAYARAASGDGACADYRSF